MVETMNDIRNRQPDSNAGCSKQKGVKNKQTRQLVLWIGALIVGAVLGIFGISLTIAYAIYYAVMITRDLYGKKEEAKSNEEVFDISNITEEEAAVAVNESDGGFSVADKQYDTGFQDGTSYDEGYGMGTENNGMSDYSPETDSSGREDDVDEDEGNEVNQQKPKNTAESLQEKMDGQMESTSPIWIDGLWQDDFTESLLKQGETKPGQPNIKTIPVKDEI